ncbi:MAG TPA: regulatory protein RecX [Mycobacteriales bacterium]|jgi:regulatory protein|nr:regulatory protein RecX [Mycobacteriales bacterium]
MHLRLVPDPPEVSGASGGEDEREIDAARELCLRSLHGRSRTRYELAELLRRKGVSQYAIREALDRLERVGLVDDERFVQDWVTLYGPSKSKPVLARELRRRGCDAATVDAVLATSPEHPDAAHAVIVKRWGSLRGLPEHVQLRRAQGLLARRGFDPQLAAASCAALREGDASG